MKYKKLREELINALQWEKAHASFTKATADMDFHILGKSLPNSPYTIWQLTEHVRLVQNDILNFCVNENYKAPNWPKDYWKKETIPPTIKNWDQSLQKIHEDRQKFIQLLKDENRNLFEPFPWGNGQNLYREAMLIKDHESYHTGQIILIRKLLGRWN